MIDVIVILTVWFAGIITGIYFSSQIERSIENNINGNRKLLKNIKKYDKRKNTKKCN